MTAVALALVLAIALRLLGAWLRPVWVDEAATAIFSAGNSSWSTPMNTLVPVQDFVTALRLAAPEQLVTGLSHLRIEDNHPPLHFAVAFLLAQLLQGQPPMAVLDPLTARLPAVLMGSLAVPLLAKAVLTATGNTQAARFAGLLMALSPLAVALGLEARHYALATTLVCGALWALAASWQRWLAGRALGGRLIGAWLGVNGLGMLSHHLFVLCIAAQLLSLIVLVRRNAGRWIWPVQLIGVPALSLLLGLAWVGRYGGGGATDQTAWLNLDRSAPGQWLAMPLQMLVTALTGLLAPGTTVIDLWQWPLVVAAGLATAVGLAALGRLVLSAGDPEPLLLVFTLSSAAMLIAASVLSGKDFSRALRYGFVILPGLLSLLAVAAAQANAKGRGRIVRVLLCCSLLCSLGVAAGVALPASYNPELLHREVKQRSANPIVLVFNDRLITVGNPLIGYEGLSIAWHLQRSGAQGLVRRGMEPRLMLLSGGLADRAQGMAAITQLKGPFDLWVVNAHGAPSVEITRSDCHHQRYASAGGHLHDQYRCTAKGLS
jgi:Dolichyl-phosphate-mannose-protein mannosyltransferase